MIRSEDVVLVVANEKQGKYWLRNQTGESRV